MKLDQQVVSLELAQKLKGLGVKQESLFKWIFIIKRPYELVYLPVEIKKSFSAFTLAELGEMLPSNYQSYRKGGDGLYTCEFDLELWEIEPEFAKRIDADTEADARAKMLIYLLENNLITL